LYIGDRHREAELRKDVMVQLNDHTEMINKVQRALMENEQERLLKSAEIEVERQVFSMSSRDTNSTVSSQKRCITTKRERPPTKEVLAAKTYDVYNTMLPQTSSQYTSNAAQSHMNLK
jgi:membrane-associated HD superfamily phosphohydrolase